MKNVIGDVGSMVKQKQKIEIKGDRAQLWLDGYTRAILEELMATGDFKSISQLLQIAVINLYKDYEAKGKLRRPPEDAEERSRNAQLAEERDEGPRIRARRS
ncbi:MAG: hypothetical protein XD40_1868 [Archaeoglobus fulgidus]|uniref:Uncharacterized protein n=1 Tax=Archaeoglobus fulgidus TaxID=2234 RepID=A0A101E0T0_ARCFL|nr:hypothetical protein [Archaeoglobus fulgidus]KUJ92943.1 MAG: hypothetical protein XD40_1868 [Archaeoglobus fulgidus]KUK06422.1 MAG: hypothetical protein XD48_1349 [Archaeoglobus fulgidus]